MRKLSKVDGQNIWKQQLTKPEALWIQGRSCTTNLIRFYSRIIDIIQEGDGWSECVLLESKENV